MMKIAGVMLLISLGTTLILGGIILTFISINQENIIKEVSCYDRNNNLIKDVVCIEEKIPYGNWTFSSILLGVFVIICGIVFWERYS